MNLYGLLISSLLISVASTVAQTPRFTEVSSEAGLDYIYPGNDFQMAGGGLMVIDVNNDGWEDFYQSGGVFDSKLWINDHGYFVDGTAAYGLDVLSGYFIQGAVSADYDNDGYQDFVVVNYGAGMSRGDKHSPVIMHNVKGKSFEMIRLDSLIAPGDFASACWGDINNDGFSDLYLVNYVATMGGISDSNGVEIGYNPTCFKNKLLLNLEGKGFRECAEEFGVDDGGCGLAASFTDVDMDGDVDLLLLNDFGEWTNEGNRYYRNNYPDPGFTDISEETGFSKKMYGMGIGQGDFDHDADLDYYVTNIGENSLYRNDDGIFSDVANEMGLDITFVYDSVRGTSWSGLFLDVDFDGDLDLYVSKGNVATLVPKTAVSDRNKLFLNEDGVFTDVTLESGVGDILSHRGSVVFDYDHDGDLDIASSVVKLPWSAFSRVDQKMKLYRNNSDVGNWIGIHLVGLDSVNADCFGCRALIVQNNQPTIREVDGGSGQASQSSRILYFGLGEARRLDHLTVYWTDGTKTVFERLKGGTIYTINSRGEISKRD